MSRTIYDMRVAAVVLGRYETAAGHHSGVVIKGDAAFLCNPSQIVRRNTDDALSLCC